MSNPSNPSSINLEFLRKQAKLLLKQCRENDPAALGRIRAQLDRLPDPIKLADVQHALAHEHGGWPPLIYACASPLNRLSSRHSAGITESVKLLLDAGADPNTFTLSDPSNPESRVSAAYRAVVGMKIGVLFTLQ
jgi:hypothetical protein